MRVILPFLVLASTCWAGPVLAQVTVTLSLTPGNNLVTASSTDTLGLPGVPAFPNGNVAQWEGTITVQLDDAFHPTTLTIVSADLIPRYAGSFAPGVPSNPTGIAPANFAFNGYGGGSSPTAMLDAIRDARATLGSTAIPLSGAAGNYGFAPGAVSFAPTAGALDYRIRMNPTGRLPLPTTFVGNAATTNGTFTSDGTTLSMQLPLDSTIVMLVPYISPPTNPLFRTTFQFTGVLTATGAIPEPSTWAITALGMAGLVLGRRRRKKKERWKPEPGGGSGSRRDPPFLATCCLQSSRSPQPSHAPGGASSVLPSSLPLGSPGSLLLPTLRTERRVY